MSLEPLLYKYRVNIGFYGHNHVVQRQAAVLNKTVIQHATKSYDENGNVFYIHDNPKATVHLVIGTAGASFTYTSVSPRPEWNEYYFYKYGYGIFTAYNESMLEYKWINNEDNSILDNVIFYQDLYS